MFQRLTKIVHCNKYDSINVFLLFISQLSRNKMKRATLPSRPFPLIT